MDIEHELAQNDYLYELGEGEGEGTDGSEWLVRWKRF